MPIISQAMASLLTFVVAVLVGFFSISTANASTEKVTGYWTMQGSTYLYKFEAHFELKDTVDGYFLWTLLASPRSSESKKIGLQGKEFVKGTFDKNNRQLRLKGYTKEDPHVILGLDEYRLEVSNDGKEFFGTTSAHGSWNGRISSKIDQASAGTSRSSEQAAQTRARQAQERRDAQAREQAAATACSNLYVGKPVGVRVNEYLFGPKRPLDAVITGIGNGRASFKIVDSIYTSHYGQTGEMSCLAY